MRILAEQYEMLDLNLPKDFENLTDEKKKSLCKWIEANIMPRKTFNYSRSSYGMKHLFEKSEGGFYVTNGQFKGAMLKCGFEPANENELNWHFRISTKSPAFHERQY